MKFMKVIKFLIRVLIIGSVILGLAHILPGLEVPNFPDAVLFALIVAVLHATITPLLIIISFPLTVMTVGLFALLINVFVFWLASLISYGIHITSFWGAFWGGTLTLLTSLLVNTLLVERPPPPPRGDK